jgi:hypothetical protein
MPIQNIKHGAYIAELKGGYSQFAPRQDGPPLVATVGAKDWNGANFTMGWSYITYSFVMVADSHHHDFEQFLFFLGHNPNNIVEFDAEIEFGLDGQINSITYPACIHIPKGVQHGPLNFKRITKPVVFMDLVLSPEPSVRPPPPGVNPG